jgi:sortase A
MRMILPVLIILIGLGIIIYPTAKEKYADYQSDKALEELEKLIASGEDDIDIDISLGYGESEDVGLGEEDDDDSEIVTGKAIGAIYIDKIELALPIGEGTSSQALDGSIAGHEPDTANLNEFGNCALASHRSLTYGRNFNRLDEIELNDEIRILSTSGTVTYIVNKVYKVKRTNIEPLAQPKDENVKMITLITCDPKGVKNPPNRLIVQAIAE